jgi:hypothetical protein
MVMSDGFPRELTPHERELLLWVLPAERSGYRAYRACVDRWKVAAQGRRGEGNYILAPAGEQVDLESPLPHVVAYGVVVAETGELSVSVRELVGNQLEFEIVGVRGEVDLSHARERRRWSLSSWLPDQPCPQCERAIRQVPIASTAGQRFVLAVCTEDQRLWLHDEQSGVNLPIPVSNFYNELMLHKNIRDPKIALDAKRLFLQLSEYSDADLQRAFRSYNQLRTKVTFEGDIIVPEQRPSLWKRLLRLFTLRTS